MHKRDRLNAAYCINIATNTTRSTTNALKHKTNDLKRPPRTVFSQLCRCANDFCVTHCWHHQDSMNTSAREKWRCGETGGGESIRLRHVSLTSLFYSVSLQHGIHLQDVAAQRAAEAMKSVSPCFHTHTHTDTDPSGRKGNTARRRVPACVGRCACVERVWDGMHRDPTGDLAHCDYDRAGVPKKKRKRKYKNLPTNCSICLAGPQTFVFIDYQRAHASYSFSNEEQLNTNLKQWMVLQCVIIVWSQVSVPRQNSGVPIMYWSRKRGCGGQTGGRAFSPFKFYAGDQSKLFLFYYCNWSISSS